VSILNRERTLLVFIFLVALPSIIWATGAVPQFDNLVENALLNATEDSLFTFIVVASDAESEYPLVFTHDADETNLTSFELITLNDTHALINFTPTNDEITLTQDDYHAIHITIQENSSFPQQSTTRQIFFNITNVNDAPNVTIYTPGNLSFIASENSSVNFTFDYNAADIDIQWGDSLTAYWYVNGILNASDNSSAGNWSYDLGFCEATQLNITLRVADEANTNGTVNWTINVTNINRLPSFNLSNNITNKTWQEDTDLLNNITLDDHFDDPDYDDCFANGDVPVFTYVLVNGFGNITVNISNSTPHNVSFHPDLDFTGIEVIYFVMNDTNGGIAFSNNITLNVTNQQDPPVFDPDPLGNQTAWVAALFVLDVNATDTDGDTLTYGDNTTLFAINTGSGLISFTPGVGDVGNHTITINVTDGFSVINTTFIFRIDPNSAPVLANISSPQNANEGATFVLFVSATDADGDNLTFTINKSEFTGPAGNNTHVTFTWSDIEDSASNKTHNISITVTDIRGVSDTTTFLLNITGINFPPILTTIPNVTFRVNKSLIYTLTATDSDGDSLNFSSNDTRVNLTAITNTSSRINLTHAIIESFTVNISVMDNSLIDWQEVLFNFTDNHAPVISFIGIQNATEDITFNLNLSDFVNDPDTNIFYTENLTYAINATWITLNIYSGAITFLINDSQTRSGLQNISFNVSDDVNTTSISFIINISPVNDPPVFDQSVSNLSEWNSVLEGIQRLIPGNADPGCPGTSCFINASDEEGDPISFGVQFLSGPNTTLFNWTSGPSTGTAYFNFTPVQADVGNYTINVSVTDDQGAATWEVFNFSVLEVDSAPNISQIFPFGTPLSNVTIFAFNMSDQFPNRTTTINLTEGMNIFFNQSSFDAEGANLTFIWQFNGVSVSTNATWVLDLNYTHSGTHEVVVYASDGTNSSNFTWILNVTNIALSPTFGVIVHSSEADFFEGTLTNTSVNTSGSVILNTTDGQNYCAVGTYLSPIINLRETNLLQTITLGVFNFTEFNYSTDVSSNTSISLELRVRNETATSNFTFYNNLNDTTGILSISTPLQDYLHDYRHDNISIQYRFNLATNQTTVTPSLHEIQLHYQISNLTIDEAQQITWLDLDEFFENPDPDFSPVYTAGGHNTAFVTISIDNPTHVVTIESPSGSITSDQSTTVAFNLTTGCLSVSSNEVVIFIRDTTNGTQQSSGGGGGGSSGSSSSTVIQIPIPQPIEITKETLLNVELLTPSEVIIYQNETIIAPITVRNNANTTLFGVQLEAISNNSDITLSFTQDYFAQLDPGQEEVTNLIITSYTSQGTYEIRVVANVTDPATSDTAMILINSIEKGTYSPEEINTRIAFTRDLLSSNPQCLELTEMLVRAERAISQGELGDAQELLSVVLENCRFLVTTETKGPPMTGFQRFYRGIFGNVPTTRALRYIAITVVAFLFLFLLVLFERLKVWKKIGIKRRKYKKKPKKPRMESA